MFVLALIGQKGGPGKTTLAINLAAAAAEQGLAAVIIDLDTQASAANWKDRRSAENPAVVSAVPSRVRQTLDAARQHGAEFVVIDNPGHSDNGAITAANFADLVLVPVEAHASNLETLPSVRRLLQATQNRTPPAYVVVNKMHPAATKQADAVKELIVAAYEMPVCPHHLSNLDVYATTQDAGQSVLDADPQGRAAAEVRELYKFTVSQSNKLESPHVKNEQSAKRA